jgi:hypothetical protein
MFLGIKIFKLIIYSQRCKDTPLEYQSLSLSFQTILQMLHPAYFYFQMERSIQAFSTILVPFRCAKTSMPVWDSPG